MYVARNASAEHTTPAVSGSTFIDLRRLPRSTEYSFECRRVALQLRHWDLAEVAAQHRSSSFARPIKAILGFAQSIKIADATAPADASLAARTIAGAIRPQEAP
jgi:hypothetical protein